MNKQKILILLMASSLCSLPLVSVYAGCYINQSHACPAQAHGCVPAGNGADYEYSDDCENQASEPNTDGFDGETTGHTGCACVGGGYMFDDNTQADPESDSCDIPACSA